MEGSVVYGRERNRLDFNLTCSFARVEWSANQGSWDNSLRLQSQLLAEVPTRSPNHQNIFWSKDFLHNLHLVRADRLLEGKLIFAVILCPKGGSYCPASGLECHLFWKAFSPSIQDTPIPTPGLPTPFTALLFPVSSISTDTVISLFVCHPSTPNSRRAGTFPYLFLYSPAPSSVTGTKRPLLSIY